MLKKGNARYKASELGKGRNLMATKLESTWKKLHTVPVPAKQIPPAAVVTRPVPVTVKGTAASTPRPARAQGSEPTADYTFYQSGSTSYTIGTDGDNRRYFIPEKVMEVFDDEFDYREVANHKDLTDLAVALFVGIMSAQAAPSGGGGDSNGLPWGRDKDEDELERARRCAREAARRIGKKPRTGRKR